jgi:hypothetical protein
MDTGLIAPILVIAALISTITTVVFFAQGVRKGLRQVRGWLSAPTDRQEGHSRSVIQAT